MSSSSDIEKLFEQFGGDANAYQEIGRESDARTARTRWPLLVTLDLTQPAIPEIGQLREAKLHPQATAPVAVSQQDDTPKDVAAVTRAKAPLFTRSHRRDIPPVAAAPEKPAMPSDASWRFGAADPAELERSKAASEAGQTAARGEDAALAPAAASASAGAPAPVGGVPVAPIAPTHTPSIHSAAAQAAASTPPAVAAASAPGFVAAAAGAPIPPATAPMSAAPIPPVAAPGQIPPAATPAWSGSNAAPVAPIPLANPSSSAFHFRAPPAQPAPSAAPAWARTAAPAHAGTNSVPSVPIAPIAPMQSTQPAPSMQTTQPQQAASILGKLFAPTPSVPQQPAASTREPASLQSVFDRLRGTPAHGVAAPSSTQSSTVPGTPNSWLINGPRRS